MSASGKPLVSAAARRALDLRFVELMDKMRRNRAGDDTELLRRAYEFAAEHHADQTRASGEPYLSHPLEVAHILADLRLDMTTLCAALLHDVVEDTRLRSSALPSNSVPKSRAWWKASPKSAAWICSHRKRARRRASAKCCWPWSPTYAWSSSSWPTGCTTCAPCNILPEQQERIARETLDIYAPIAHRLGMGAIRGDLEDLAFSYLEPPAYVELQKKVAAQQKSLTNSSPSVRRRFASSWPRMASRPTWRAA